MGITLMNNEDNRTIEALAVWGVETADVSARVMSAIGASAPSHELLVELRALRQEMQEIRQSNSLLQDEIARLRHELIGRAVTRIAPYAPTEGLIRLA